MPLRVQFRALTYNKNLIKINKVRTEVIKYLNDVEQEILSDVTYYPPYISPTYVRTGALGRGWISSIRETTAGLFLYIRNVGVPYAEYVQGVDQQPIFKAIGWITLHEVVERVRKSFRKDVQEIVSDSID